MLRLLGTIFAGLLGLAFGSFLNVCLSRWPAGESIVTPRSHCRTCNRTLVWWENIPVMSWLILRGRCRTCGTRISVRYPLVELSIGVLWAVAVYTWSPIPTASFPDARATAVSVIDVLGQMILCWLLVALAALDAENLWLPDRLTLPGAATGFLVFLLDLKLNSDRILDFYGAKGLQSRVMFQWASNRLAAILAAALLILIIRWLYKLIRHREGIGLGDAKLMALLAAWLGLPGALLSFSIGVFLGAIVALVVLAIPVKKRNDEAWSLTKLPLGTFLCIGGIISALWGHPILAAYSRFAGF
jgi:leader peptidase (prepilin peptidase)/N-methyltransferase